MKLAYHCAHSPTAQALLKDLVKTYGQVPLDEAEVLIAIGGDGSMLHSLHMALDNDIPVYGINRGSVGTWFVKFFAKVNESSKWGVGAFG